MEHRYPTSSEEAEQAAVIEYCDLLRVPVVHVPNEGKRTEAYGARLKRLGMRKGFPDLFFPLARGQYHGLFIEMKYGEGRPTPEQKQWLLDLAAEGYACAVCYSSREAIRIIEKYRGLNKETRP